MPGFASPLANGRTNPQGFLPVLSKLFTTQGVIEPNALKVSAQLTPDMTVVVSGSLTDDNAVFIAAGNHFIQAWNSDNKTVTIAANTSGVVKTDAIVAYIDLAGGTPATPNNPDSLKLAPVRRGGVQTGQPTQAEIEAVAGIGNPYMVLAHVTVANGASSINSGNITDHRPFARLSGSMLSDGSITNSMLSTAVGELGGAWQTWSPTIAGQGSMSVSSVVINLARFKVIGKTVMFQISANLTTGGSATNTIQFSLPVTAISTTQFLPSLALDSGSSAPAVGYIAGPNPTTGAVEKISGNFTIGAGRGIRSAGVYEAA